MASVTMTASITHYWRRARADLSVLIVCALLNNVVHEHGRTLGTRTAIVAWKEFIQMRRDRLTLGMMIGIPLLQLILFGFAINSDPRHLPTAVLLAEQERDWAPTFVGLIGQADGAIELEQHPAQAVQFTGDLRWQGKRRRADEGTSETAKTS